MSVNIHRCFYIAVPPTCFHLLQIIAMYECDGIYEALTDAAICFYDKWYGAMFMAFLDS
jgi:hypothetical protein